MKGIVYKIFHPYSLTFYIGSSIQSLKERKRLHKRHYGEWKEEKYHLISSFLLFEEYGFEKCIFVVIKEYEVVDEKHLRIYEQLWMNKYKEYIMNQHSAFCIEYLYQKQYKKKYREENKEKISEYQKKYYEENKEEISEKRKEKYTCECGSTFRKSYKYQHEKTQKHQSFINNKIHQ